MTPGIAWNADDHFLDRVKKAYRRAREMERKLRRRSVWGKIFERQRPVHEALLTDSHEPLRAIFRNPASTDLFFGVDNLCKSILPEITSNDGHGDYIGKLLSNLDTDTSVFTFPNPFYGEIGLQSDRGLISYRAVQAIYQAIAVRKLLPENGSVLEIGPGMGRTVLHCRQIGITNYTTVDLPMGVVAQACFLGATIGSDAIWFTTDQSSPRGKIRILSQADLTTANERFDLILNVDSIIETGLVASSLYARWIKQHCDRFLSINRNSPRMSLVRLQLGHSESRLLPLWPGYIEDVFSFVSVRTDNAVSQME